MFRWDAEPPIRSVFAGAWRVWRRAAPRRLPLLCLLLLLPLLLRLLLLRVLLLLLFLLLLLLLLLLMLLLPLLRVLPHLLQDTLENAGGDGASGRVELRMSLSCNPDMIFVSGSAAGKNTRKLHGLGTTSVTDPKQSAAT